MAREAADNFARLWAAEDKLLAQLDKMARKPATGTTTADLHTYQRAKDALQARPFDPDKFAVELAAFLALAEVTPEAFEEAAQRTAT